MSCGQCLPAGLDCSEEAQAARRQRLADLQAKMTSGVASASDRGRSVTYRTAYAEVRPIIALLQKEITACETGVWPRIRRLGYIDQIKGL